MDVVYPVRPGEHNPELRYSLRSLANLPHDRVFIVGHRPRWVSKDVELIEGNTQGANALANFYFNILLACRHPEISDPFLLFNDDFYVTEPLQEIPVWHGGSMGKMMVRRQARRVDWWSRALARTLGALKTEGVEAPISYELHLPMPVQKAPCATALEAMIRPRLCLPRSVYGNLAGIGGTERADAKNWRNGRINFPLHSTQDSSWPMSAGWFRRAFSEPCAYESTPASLASASR